MLLENGLYVGGHLRKTCGTSKREDTSGEVALVAEKLRRRIAPTSPPTGLDREALGW